MYFAMRADGKVKIKESENIDKYLRETPVVVDVFGMMPKRLE